jgi:hypothetical protein
MYYASIVLALLTPHVKKDRKYYNDCGTAVYHLAIKAGW